MSIQYGVFGMMAASVEGELEPAAFAAIDR
jgi:hypothetical protein